MTFRSQAQHRSLKIRATRVIIVVSLMNLVGATANAQYAVYSADHDTISVPGQTVVTDHMTIEARFMLLSGLPFSGRRRIFEEQRDSLEDKSILVGSSQISGIAWKGPGDNGNDLVANVPVPPGVWHHVAFVRDGAAERLYFDGLLVASRAVSTAIQNSALSAMSIGGFQPQPIGAFRPSFLGRLDWVRVSSSSRYVGTSFSLPECDPEPDSDTLLLYNFDEEMGATEVQDESPNHWTGLLGVGEPMASSPTLGGGLLADCNGNGRADECDIALGTSCDANMNGIPDECEPPRPGDLNCDGCVNIDDETAFALLLIDPSAYGVQYPSCPQSLGDLNNDGAVDGLDIQPFVAAVVGG
ncbi:MAG: hypothetical protein B6D36_13545 [Planctomycetes bacterium UTPLA1]|nr:MAG: hypothetical protein B6D36_13545 [Planctomycetes bacterium UTPLA1]